MAVDVVGICGSLRSGSYNRMLLANAIERSSEGLRIEEVSFRGWPVYDQDLEEAGVPDAIAVARERIARADGLLLVSPEYNYSVPGPLKNAFDWLSRPPGGKSAMFRKPVGTIGASTGWAGTERAQLVWLFSFRFMHMPYFTGHEVHVSMAREAFDADGKLTSELFLKDLDAYLPQFRDWLETIKRARG